MINKITLEWRRKVTDEKKKCFQEWWRGGGSECLRVFLRREGLDFFESGSNCF